MVCDGWKPKTGTLAENLALGMWNDTCLMGKEWELVRKVEKFQLDKVGLTLTHGKGSGTSLLKSFFYN